MISLRVKTVGLDTAPSIFNVHSEKARTVMVDPRRMNPRVKASDKAGAIFFFIKTPLWFAIVI